MVLQKHIRWMKCLNLYQMSAVPFFILIEVACSMSNLSEAGFGCWLLAGNCDDGDAGGCVSMTLWWMPFVVLAIISSIFDVIVIGSECMSSRLADCSSKLSVDIVVRSWFGASSSCAISMLMPLCFANNFNSSIASRASRFSCKNLYILLLLFNVHAFHRRIVLAIQCGVILCVCCVCITISGSVSNGSWHLIFVPEQRQQQHRRCCRNKQWKMRNT